jgi:hypothetical protein
MLSRTTAVWALHRAAWVAERVDALAPARARGADSTCPAPTNTSTRRSRFGFARQSLVPCAYRALPYPPACRAPPRGCGRSDLDRTPAQALRHRSPVPGCDLRVWPPSPTPIHDGGFGAAEPPAARDIGVAHLSRNPHAAGRRACRLAADTDRPGADPPQRTVARSKPARPNWRSRGSLRPPRAHNLCPGTRAGQLQALRFSIRGEPNPLHPAPLEIAARVTRCMTRRVAGPSRAPSPAPPATLAAGRRPKWSCALRARRSTRVTSRPLSS